MTDEAERWKEKYLKSLEQQEKLERRWEARLDLLRRGLVRSTLAAEGSDKVVDQCMKEMREVIRGDSMDAGLAGLIPRLETAVLESEQRRETRMNQVSDALTSLVAQLQALELPGEVSRPLKKLAKRLDGGVSQSRELPPLLGELSGLQEQALSSLRKSGEDHRPNLFQRLFGARDDSPPAPVEESPEREEQAVVEPPPPPSPASPPPVADEAVVDEPQPPSQAPAVPPAVVPVGAEALPQVQPSPVAAPPADVDAEPSAALAVQASAEMSEGSSSDVPAALPDPAPEPVEAVEQAVPDDSAQAPETDEPPAGEPAPESAEPPEGDFALPTGGEPPYSQVAEHIEQTLIGLLDELSLPERHQAQALDMRLRVSRGLNWYELIPVLDDLAVLMLAINDSGQHEFEAYLQQINTRLANFQSHLQEASAGHADNSDAARQLDDRLREQVDGLQSSVQGAVDLESLKHVLDNRLEGLLGTLDQHRLERDRREQALAARLQGLAERVSSMEQEAQGYREHLEEQRQKALLDPLTGLPNRAAWAEQVDREVGRWQTEGGHLAMAILDLDHFKRINDGYGHLAGDKVLKIVADQLRKRLRGRDFIARFGGEEFVLLLPDTPPAQAVRLVDDLRAAVQACPFHFKGERVVITTSIGVAALRSGERGEQALKRADEALYRAKDQGRNRVEHSDSGHR
ncbi:diguanylate cyclase [Pseudomonas sp. S75]|uniref:GGDEF domain-containing protein n=1 Tax=unclassified Pseudomonas TaxID=196821 RepID=UPI0019056429|nr:MULTISPECIES: GGDEF domain-containing protein [unclassified Pseudomonas]MBJ9974549.1 diguanylate cyclase [Pseudomonas sp. S30]MBK0153328.1 diguanylate cyclase [Pseudomonas sp. S75]